MRAPFPIPRSYLVLDLETTGRDPRECGIVEVAVARVADGQVVDSWSTLANPGRPCDPGAQDAHKIPPADVAAAPALGDVLPELVLGWLADDLPVVAYNGDTFDRIVLESNAAALGVPLPALTWYDPLPMARRMMPGRPSYRLGHVASALGVVYAPGQAAHRAAADVAVLAGVVEGLRALADAAPVAAPAPAALPAPAPAPADDPPPFLAPAKAPAPPVPAADAAPLVARAQAALAPVAARVAAWIAKADDLACDDDADEKRVIDALATFRNLANDAVKLRLQFTDEIGRQKRQIEADFRDHALRPIDGVIERLENKRKPLALARAQAAAAERARLEREAAAMAEAERQRTLAAQVAPAQDAVLEATLAGDTAGAAQAMQAAADGQVAANVRADLVYEGVVATAAAIAPAPVKGDKAIARDRIVWRVTVTAPRLVPPAYCSPDLDKLQAAIAAANGDIQIPGVEFVADVATSTRARRGA